MAEDDKKKKVKHVIIQSRPPKEHIPSPEEMMLSPLFMGRREDVTPKGKLQPVAKPFRRTVKDDKDEWKEEKSVLDRIFPGLLFPPKKKDKK